MMSYAPGYLAAWINPPKQEPDPDKTPNPSTLN
jgi:hypothetical protein